MFEKVMPKNMKSAPKWTQNGSPNPEIIDKKHGPKIDAKKGRVYATAWEGRRVGRDAPSNVLTSQDVSSSSFKRLNVHTLRFLTPLRYTHRLG